MTQAMLRDPFALTRTCNGRGITRTGTGRGAPAVEDFRIDEFLEAVYGLGALEDLQGATDKIFETVDRLLLEGAFTVCNEILCRVDVHKLPTALMRSFLTITAAAKDKLPARKAFYNQVLSEMIRLKGNEKAERLLGQLA